MQKTFVLLALTAVAAVNAISGTDVVYIVGGLMEGIIHKDDLAELEKCMTGTEGLATDIENCVTHFEEGTTAGYIAAF